ncbi:hypothetical protein OJ253_3090, partial [Cryptosporidium canis]
KQENKKQKLLKQQKKEASNNGLKDNVKPSNEGKEQKKQDKKKTKAEKELKENEEGESSSCSSKKKSKKTKTTQTQGPELVSVSTQTEDVIVLPVPREVEVTSDIEDNGYEYSNQIYHEDDIVIVNEVSDDDSLNKVNEVYNPEVEVVSLSPSVTPVEYIPSSTSTTTTT